MAHIDSENNSIINKLPLNDSSMTANGTQQLPPLPEGLEPLGHQLAGHKFGDKANAHLYGRIEPSYIELYLMINFQHFCPYCCLLL